MTGIPDFNVELSQTMECIMGSALAEKVFANPPFMSYTNVLRHMLQNIDRLSDNCHMPEFTNHALPHICSIVQRASEWAKGDGWLDRISEQETGYLLMALVVHDIGMLSQDAADLPDLDRSANMKGFSDISNWVRRTHVIRLEKLVLRLMREEIEKDASLEKHLRLISRMAASHQKWMWDPEFIPDKVFLAELGVDAERIRALNAVIAVCDLLDEDSSRCDTVTLIRYRHGSMENMAHWIRHALTVQVGELKNHAVRVSFRRLKPSETRHEKVYRALRNHYRLIKLYNECLKNLDAEIAQVMFEPADGIPLYEDEISDSLEKIWKELPEFADHMTEQLLSTFMPEALNQTQDPNVRKRLDAIGMETLDLTEEETFLYPETIYFPEERPLFRQKDFQSQLAWMKALADEACLDGKIGKLRHITYTALEFVKERAGTEVVSLNEIYWIYIYLSVYQIFGHESEVYLETLYSNEFLISNRNAAQRKRIGENINIRIEGPYQKLLDIWLALLGFQIGKNEEKLCMDYLRGGTYEELHADPATQLLMEKLIGWFWYAGADGIWRDMKDTLCECLCKIPPMIGIVKKLEHYAGSLELADRVLNQRDRVEDWPVTTDLKEELVFAKAWESFWNEDVEKEKRLIAELCRIGNHNHDYMESVQGYLNMVRRAVKWNEYLKRQEQKKQDGGESVQNDEKKVPLLGINEEKEARVWSPSETAGLNGTEDFDEKQWEREIAIGGFRYPRIQMEQPFPVFLEYRQNQIETSIHAIYRREKGNASTDKVRALRLLILQTLEAVQSWNLARYIECLRQQMRIEFLDGTYMDSHGEYRGSKRDLSDCLIHYMECLDSKEIINDSELQTLKKCVIRYAPEELERLTDYICAESRLLSWKTVLSVIALFAENYTEEQRKRLVVWLARYNTYYQEQGKKRYINTTQYEFLKDWCQKLKEDEWQQLRGIVQELFRSEDLLSVNQKLVDELFRHMPWDWCEEFLSRMSSWQENRRKSGILYSAVILLSKRPDVKKEFLHQYVGQCIERVDALIKKYQTEKIDPEEKMQKDAIEEEEDSQFQNYKEALPEVRASYQELDALIDIQKLSERDPIDLDMVEAAIRKFEQAVKDRGGLSGYDSRLIRPLEEVFINKNWDVKDTEQEKQLVGRLMNVMLSGSKPMSKNFFHNFCSLFFQIEKTCGKELLRFINHFVMKKMVKKRFETVSAWGVPDSPYANFRFDDGMHHQYEIMVSLLLLSGMTALTKTQRAAALDFVIQALRTDEAILYQYAAIFCSYHFLKAKQSEEIVWRAWGGLQRILGRISIRDESEKAGEIRKLLRGALDVLKDSEDSKRWFGKKGYDVYVRENTAYRDWEKEMDERLMEGEREPGSEESAQK